MFYYMYDHPLLEKPVKISYVYEYQSYYRVKRGLRIKNPAFDFESKLILDLKRNSFEAMEIFSERLIKIFDCLDDLDKLNFAVIPSHDVNIKITRGAVGTIAPDKKVVDDDDDL